MIKQFKEYFIPIISAFIFFIAGIIFKVDKLFFNCPGINYNHMIFIKSLYFILLCTLLCFGFKVFKEIKNGNEIYKRGFNIFLVYFSIMLGLIIITWPGLWAWDDIWTLESDYKYMFHSWQHILTSVFHQIFLQILPFPCGIIIIQNLIISIMVAFITVKLENTYNIFLKNKFLDTVLKLIPFLLLPVLRFQFSGYRYSLYLLIELTFLCMLLCMSKEKKEENTSYLILFSVICAISAVWRSESFIYLFLGAGFLFFAKFTGNKIKRISAILLIICIFATINYFQVSQIKSEHNKDYELTATVSQATILVRNTDEEENAELLNKINKVIDISVIYNNPDYDGMRLFWYKNLVRKDFTEKDYNEYIKSLITGTLKYPKVIIKERLNVWHQTFLPDINNGLYNGEFILSALNEKKTDEYILNFFKETPFLMNKPIFKQLRDKTVLFLCFDKNPKMSFIVQNSIFPLCFILVFLINTCIKKQKIECFLISVILFKQILIMLTQPEANFQYYFTVYITGYIILFYALILTVNKLSSKFRVSEFSCLKLPANLFRSKPR